MTTKHLTLYDLTEEMELAQSEMDVWAAEHDGDITDFPLNDVMATVAIAREKKIINIAMWVKSLNAEGDAHKAEEASQAKKKKQAYAKAERLMAYIENNMDRLEKIKDPRVEIFFKKNPPSVKPLIDIALMPGDYLTRPKPEISLTKLKDDMVEIMEPVFDNLGQPVYEEAGSDKLGDIAPSDRKQKTQPAKVVIAEIAEPVFGEDGQQKTDPETGDSVFNHVTKTIARMVQAVKLSIK